MSTVILELNRADLASGYITATKIDDKGQRKGKMPLSDVADLLQDIFRFDAGKREVRMISRFEDSPFLAWGQNGSKWVAVKVIEPGSYYLVSVSGKAYEVKLPRLIAKVGNHSSTFLYWVEDGPLTPETKCYPLMIGNIDWRGWVCLGTSGLRCESPDSIDEYVRKVIEVPATGTYLTNPNHMDKLYQTLTKRWASGIGRKHAVKLSKIIASGRW